VIRVMLVDDHPVLRDGLKDLLGGYDDLEVVGAAADGAEAGRLAAIAEPDVVLMDLRMPGTDGVAGTAAVKQAVPTAKVLLLTALSDYAHIIRALECGADGYLLKDAPASDVIDGIRRAMAGELNPQTAIRELTGQRGDGLSERDTELLRLTIAGRVPADHSLTGELVALYRRIGVEDAESAALWARRHGVA
jgi:DNA-binding NarL/FixJ family response regulator